MTDALREDGSMPEVVDLSAARAARLASLTFQELPTNPQQAGPWRWRVVGGEVQLRSKRLPHLFLDLTTTEAAQLHEALGAAVFDSVTLPVVRVPLWMRLRDWLARRTWNRRHEYERAQALKRQAEEFAQWGGW